MKKLARNISDLTDLFFPKLCITCGNRLISQEHYLCMNCWYDLPVTNFHKNADNKVAQLFWGRVEIENATSFFGYKKGSRYRELIHFIKYKGLKELGFETGRRFGLVLAKTVEFNKIDVVVPVPLHKRKLKKRGFNQSDWIASGIAEALKKPVSTENLFRHIYTQTQTKKNRFERFVNVEGIFAIKEPYKFEGKHILLIDDVVTTGSTLEACAVELLKLRDTKVSIATLAFADY
jgi:ComF family protein